MLDCTVWLILITIPFVPRNVFIASLIEFLMR